MKLIYNFYQLVFFLIVTNICLAQNNVIKNDNAIKSSVPTSNSVLESSQAIDIEIFASNLEEHSATCWNHRPDTGGWNFNGCRNLINIGRGNNLTLSENGISHSGNKAIKISYDENEDHGGVEVSITPTNRVFTRYYDYYAENFDFAFGLKTHRIRSFDKKLGINNFDTVTHVWGRSNNPANEFDMSGNNNMYLTSTNYNGGFNDWGGHYADFEFKRGRWYCVENEIKLNTVGASNGEARLWIDGKLKVDVANLKIREKEEHKLNLILFGGWYSNGATGRNPQLDPNQVSVRYIDDIAISNDRIGCEQHLIME